MDLGNWHGVPRPAREALEGAYARLEPLDAQRHARSLFKASTVPGAEDRFRYLPDRAPATFGEMRSWTEKAQAHPDALFYAVIDRATAAGPGAARH